jgi:drug/metabolite transporter (DMT)-like permease
MNWRKVAMIAGGAVGVAVILLGGDGSSMSDSTWLSDLGFEGDGADMQSPDMGDDPPAVGGGE